MAKKHFLITGGAGFIGSHLAENLLSAGHSVVAIDDLSTGRKENIESLLTHPDFQVVRETILNFQVLDRLVSQTDVIIHLAAAVGVKLIIEDPVRTINTNILGTESVLKTASRYGCKVLIASSSEVYGKGVKVPFSEDDDCILGPTTQSRWSYAVSKQVDEFLGLAYQHQFGLPVVVMRFFNTIGPRQTGQYGMVVPRFVRQALLGEPLTVYGDGSQTRCFCDVQDVCEAVIKLCDQPEAEGQVFNVGSREEISINELALKVIQLTGSNSQIVHIPYDRAYTPGFEDMQRRVPNLEKINRFSGYNPSISLDESLQKVIQHMRKNMNDDEKEY